MKMNTQHTKIYGTQENSFNGQGHNTKYSHILQDRQTDRQINERDYILLI